MNWARFLLNLFWALVGVFLVGFSMAAIAFGIGMIYSGPGVVVIQGQPVTGVATGIVWYVAAIALLVFGICLLIVGIIVVLYNLVMLLNELWIGLIRPALTNLGGFAGWAQLGPTGVPGFPLPPIPGWPGMPGFDPDALRRCLLKSMHCDCERGDGADTKSPNRIWDELWSMFAEAQHQMDERVRDARARTEAVRAWVQSVGESASEQAKQALSVAESETARLEAEAQSLRQAGGHVAAHIWPVR